MTPYEEALAQAEQACEGVENEDPTLLALAMLPLVQSKRGLEVALTLWQETAKGYEADLKVARQERDNAQAKADFYANELAFMRKRLDAQ